MFSGINSCWTGNKVLKQCYLEGAEKSALNYKLDIRKFFPHFFMLTFLTSGKD